MPGLGGGEVPLLGRKRPRSARHRPTPARQRVLHRRARPAQARLRNLSLNAFGVTLAVEGTQQHQTLNFIGSLTQKVLIGGADFVRLQTLGFTMEAAHPLFGKVTLHLPDIDVSPASILKLGPGGLVETWLQSFNATFERRGDAAGPFTFQTLDVAQWQALLPSYPPPPQGTNPDGSPTGGTLFRVQAPIRLGTVAPSGQKTTYAQLQGMNVNQGHLLA
ncbi:hypothetical protein O1G22_43145 (plasmid) [Streptomyces camelliae]|uniref:AsmA-like C-terminal domain-containing protein n=1 Tax=Streptomyces camelliae TaxID=3004093 RepID=A0ABY7PJ17_9ACTN|nr:hypothetical protein [Streptomyces sp. HUAS 2-6]WBO69553.1 hypothetical protein O1G22_43145 [Streptomyces sp. HUAS 2-6]